MTRKHRLSPSLANALVLLLRDLAAGEPGIWALITLVEPPLSCDTQQSRGEGQGERSSSAHTLRTALHSPLGLLWGRLSSSSFPAGVAVELLKGEGEKEMRFGELRPR